jgi:CRISPR/Cas system-associated exonuclease Cas4 (RecB family)
MGAQMNITWSYSSLKTFEQCPKKYYHLKVVKDVKDEGSESTLYGQELHKAAEDYIKEGKPIPPKFSYIQDTVDAIKNIPGEKHCELKLGVRKTDTGYEPCGFFDKDVWWWGIGDVIVVQDELAFSLDYKTSKNAKYADLKQLDILAAALFTHFPQIKKIKSALAFVVSNEFIHKEHFADMRDSYFSIFEPELDRLAAAQETGVWNTNTSPLCRFCPVVSCEHNRKR